MIHFVEDNEPRSQPCSAKGLYLAVCEMPTGHDGNHTGRDPRGRWFDWPRRDDEETP